MAKTISFFVGLFIIFTFFAAIGNGGGGIVATSLTSAIDADDTTLTVTTTNNFLTADYVFIESEKIAYTGVTTTPPYTFTGCSRGVGGTTAKAHPSGAKVYSPESSVLNEALGFSPGAISAVNGWTAIVTVPMNFFTRTLPNVLTFNFPFLQGGMAFLGYIFLAMSIGVLISLSVAMLYGIGTLLKR